MGFKESKVQILSPRPSFLSFAYIESTPSGWIWCIWDNTSDADAYFVMKLPIYRDMDILITNDDGILAPGMDALVQRLRRRYKVLVVAPQTEVSGCGHAISLDRPLRLAAVPDREDYYSVDGYTTDCLYVARSGLLDGVLPRLVVSGMNLGPNLGEDVTYSGTVAGAMEAAVWGAPGVAFSSVERAPEHLEAMADAAAAIVDHLMTLLDQWPDGGFLNINIPDVPGLGIDDVRVVPLGRRHYGQGLTQGTDPRGKPYWWIGGKPLGCEGAGSDCAAVAAGHIALTPLHIDWGIGAEDTLWRTAFSTTATGKKAM